MSSIMWHLIRWELILIKFNGKHSTSQNFSFLVFLHEKWIPFKDQTDERRCFSMQPISIIRFVCFNILFPILKPSFLNILLNKISILEVLESKYTHPAYGIVDFCFKAKVGGVPL